MAATRFGAPARLPCSVSSSACPPQMNRRHVGGKLSSSVSTHETFDRGVQLVPRGVDEIVVAHGKARADEKFLIRRGAAGVIRTHEIPGKFEQLHAVGGGEIAGGPERLE